MIHSLLSSIRWHLDNRTSASHSPTAMIAWHFGYRLAERNIHALQSDHAYQPAEWEADINRSFWRRRADRPFRNGYNDPWSAVGAKDAAANQCNRKLLVIHSYLTGWLAEVESRIRNGWNIDNLGEALRLVRVLHANPELTIEAAEAELHVNFSSSGRAKSTRRSTSRSASGHTTERRWEYS